MLSHYLNEDVMTNKNQCYKFLLSAFIAVTAFIFFAYANTIPAVMAGQAPLIKNSHLKSTRLWNLRNVDIRQVIQEISLETGKNFIIDPRVQGKISIVSSTPIDDQAAYQMFLSALTVLGYSAVEQGNVVKIVPSMNVKQFALPLGSPENAGVGDEPIVRIVTVKNVSAQQLVPLLRPLLPEWGSLVAYAPSNLLIIAGNASNVSHVINIIQRVDTTNADGIDVMPLHYASATQVVKSIHQLQSGDNTEGASSQVNVAAESQGNMILISGPKSARLKMRVLISELDTPNANSSRNTHVIRLHFLQAQDIVPVLAGVAESYGSTVGTVIGTISSQAAYNANEDSGTTDNDGLADSNSNNAASLPTATSRGITTEQATTSETAGKADRPKVEIIGEPNTNSIIINAPPTLMSILKAVIKQLDVRPSQVLVEAMVAEVNENAAGSLGIQWGTVNSTNATGAPNGSNTPVFQQGIGIINGSGLHGIQGVIQALQNDNAANILSTPSVVVLNNHEAKIEVGQQISVLDSNYPNNANGTTTATPYNTFNQEKVALHLYVTPSISKGNTVQLAIDQGNNTLQNPSNPTTTPIINISRIQTSVLVNSGDILVLGGLIQNQVSEGDSKVPFLGDIPIIGHLFSVHSHGHQKQMLMVFIRPIILHNPKANMRTTGKQYNFVRGQQMHWVRGQRYSSEVNHTVLQPWGKHINLPHPFD